MLPDVETRQPRVAFTPGTACWNRRAAIAASRDRIVALSRTIGRPSDLQPYQFAQLVAACLDFEPDLIIELGRGLGNSTCAFVHAANELGHGRTRVLS